MINVNTHQNISQFCMYLRKHLNFLDHPQDNFFIKSSENKTPKNTTKTNNVQTQIKSCGISNKNKPQLKNLKQTTKILPQKKSQLGKSSKKTLCHICGTILSPHQKTSHLEKHNMNIDFFRYHLS